MSMPLQGPWSPKVYAMRPLWYGAPLPVITLRTILHEYISYASAVRRQISIATLSGWPLASMLCTHVTAGETVYCIVPETDSG